MRGAFDLGNGVAHGISNLVHPQRQVLLHVCKPANEYGFKTMPLLGQARPMPHANILVVQRRGIVARGIRGVGAEHY